jgi:hypothetical protein
VIFNLTGNSHLPNKYNPVLYTGFDSFQRVLANRLACSTLASLNGISALTRREPFHNGVANHGIGSAVNGERPRLATKLEVTRANLVTVPELPSAARIDHGLPVAERYWLQEDLETLAKRAAFIFENRENRALESAADE